jgi:hypothetical protein
MGARIRGRCEQAFRLLRFSDSASLLTWRGKNYCWMEKYCMDGGGLNTQRVVRCP